MALFSNFGFNGLDSMFFPNPYRRDELAAGHAGRRRAGIYGVSGGAGEMGGRRDMSNSLVMQKEQARNDQMQQYMEAIKRAASFYAMMKMRQGMGNRGGSMYSPQAGYQAPGGQGIGGGAGITDPYGVG